MTTPLLGCTLVYRSLSLVYASVVVYLVTALCIGLLQEMAGQEGGAAVDALNRGRRGKNTVKIMT